jgi:hypothetical protein
MTTHIYYYAQQLNLPLPPQKILDIVNQNYILQKQHYNLKTDDEKLQYTYAQGYNAEVNTWCQNNVCKDIRFYFQLTTNLDIHVDAGSDVKLIYFVDTGGDNVFTEFYSNDGKKLLQSIQLVSHKWYALKTSINHSVRGVDKSRTRFSIVGRLFI